MSNAPSYSELAAAVGISRSYAHEIVSTAREPSRPLAIHIFRCTGWRHSILDGLTDDQLSTLEAIEPWQPRQVAA